MAAKPPRQSGRATLSQVAARAGVSTTTASLVLGGKAQAQRISEETLRRVNEAARELDYAPNLLVRSMQRGRTHVVSFFSAFRHRRAADLYMDRLSTAIEQACGRHGYDVLVHCDFARPAGETYRFLNGGRADGLLFFAPLPDDPLLPLLRASRLPVVLLGVRDEERVLPSVKDDVESGMRQVAETLVRLGHRRVAAVTEEGSEFRDAHERISLLRAYLCEHGVDLPARRVVDFRGDALVGVRALLAEPEPPTAIFCWRDWLAYQTLAACDSLGIAVPERLSIVGYDGLPWPAATRHTAASVAVDMDALSEAAVGLLDRLIKGPQGGVEPYALPVALTPGTTLGPAPRSSTDLQERRTQCVR